MKFKIAKLHIKRKLKKIIKLFYDNAFYYWNNIKLSQ